jgi:hypothetical protein
MRRIPMIFLRRFCGGGGRIPYQLSRPPCSCPRRVSMEAGSQEAASWTSGAGTGAGWMIAPSRRVERVGLRVGVPAKTRGREGLVGRGLLNRRWTQMDADGRGLAGRARVQSLAIPGLNGGACSEDAELGPALPGCVFGERQPRTGLGQIFMLSPWYRFAPPRAIHRSSLRDGVSGEGLDGEVVSGRGR